ncbi:MAG: efflux RND transporter periplasmic adaptor subunit [Candidatus Korobacteraceae bacterium]
MLLLALGAGCGGENHAPTAAPETVRDVVVMVAEPAVVPDYIEVVGTVRAAETSHLSSQVVGTIVAIHVREASRVKRGDVLAVIDNAPAQAEVERAAAMVQAASRELAAADSELDLARTTFQRFQALIVRKSVSPQEFEEVKARLQSTEARRDAARASHTAAEATLAQARVRLGYSEIRAPFDGVVTARLADPGTLASPGTPLLVVENPSRFRLEAHVNESHSSAVRVGDSCSVTIDALGNKDLTAKVAQLVPAADAASRTFLAKIDLPLEPGLQSGQFGTARIVRGERKTLIIPMSAVVRRGQLRGVYVIGADQVASLRFVTLGDASASGVEVLTGLEAGERLVADVAGRELGARKIEAK